MPPEEFTVAQANDIARYFLGPGWKAVYLSGGFCPYLLQGPANPLGVSYQDTSWRKVFRAAGVQLPLRPQYVAKGTSVMFGATAICTAPSNTLAKRIAAALNNHTPDRRGI